MKRSFDQTDNGRVKAEIVLIAWLLALLVLYASLASAAPIGAPNPVPVANVTYKPARLVYLQAEGEAFRKPTGVFVDRESGEVVVTDSGSNLVVVLSLDGVPLYSFGYNREVPQPSQAVVDKKGRILVLAGVPRKVKVFSYRGEPIGDFGFPGFEGASKAVPTALTVDQAGNLYIADSVSGRILVYDVDGRPVTIFGKRGQETGSFSNVTAIAVDQAGLIYTADALHSPAIQVFDPKGAYVRGWGEHSGGPQNFSLPSGIGVDSMGRVLVTDTIRQTVSVFTQEGSFLFRFGGLGDGPGALAYPSSLDVDGSGRVYVTESVNARLQVFEPIEGDRGSKAAPRQTSPAPSQVREEIRRGLGDVLKGIQQ